MELSKLRLKIFDILHLSGCSCYDIGLTECHDGKDRLAEVEKMEALALEEIMKVVGELQGGGDE